MFIFWWELSVNHKLLILSSLSPLLSSVFFNSWLSDSQFCRVVEDTRNYVECACSHMSIYSASALTDNLSSYNEAFYSAAFICISGMWQL